MENVEMDNQIKRFTSLADIPDDYVTLIKQRFYAKTILDSSSIYHYCPFCVTRIRRGLQAGEDWKEEAKKELDPLSNELWKCLYKYSLENKQGIVIFENRLMCKVCKKEIKTTDFEQIYCSGPIYAKNSKLIDLDDEEALNKF